MTTNLRSILGDVLARPSRFALSAFALGLLAACAGGADSDGAKSEASAIVGGGLAEEAPWAVQIFDVRGTTGDFFQCTGTLVAPRWVLTAQHCLADDGETTAIRLGDNTYREGRRIDVDRFEVFAADVDLALVHLAEDAGSALVTLASAAPSVANTPATIYGWGSEGTPRVMAPELKKAEITLTGWYSEGNRELRTKGVTGSAWSGDSGGPIFVGREQIGILSGSIGQDGTNTTADNVVLELSKFRPWIDQTIAGSGETPDADVVLFDQADFSGISQGFGLGRHNLPDLTLIGNDRASSIRIKPGYRVTAFLDHNYEGAARVFTADTNLEAEGFSNALSSFVVARDTDPQTDVVTFYDGADFTGESFLHGVGGQFFIGGPWDNRLGSVRVPAGFEVTLYSDYWWYAPSTSVVLTSDTRLDAVGFDNLTSTLSIARR